MRPLTALLILAACQCFHAHQHPRTPRQLLKDTIHSLLGKPNKPVRRIVTCTQNLGFSKCVGALAVWRAERALDAFAKNPMARLNLTEDVEKFPWKNYSNTTNEELCSQLLDGTQKLLQYRTLTFDMISGYTAELNSKNNGSLRIDIHKADEVEGRTSMKKLQKEFYKLAPIFLAPGLFISAIVPFVLPSLKMMILMVGFMNQMALAGAVFTILRNNAFNDKYEHKVVYVNNGYENEKFKFAASNNEEHFHTNHLGILYMDPKARIPSRPIVDPPFGDEFGNIEELPPMPVNPQWIKDYTDNKMLSMLKKEPNDDVFFNDRLPIRRSKPEIQENPKAKT
ncbi:uncharacterized protein LOC142975248 [Anticarsia gemmatalis]|uniref:uncharacterized protein LOC142975248 n=1 Tax=Anticarsia gemmatalis TaxID=129554 RepID=UPI003F76B81D